MKKRKKRKVKGKVLKKMAKERRCLFCGTTKDLVKHHKKPRRLGGTGAKENIAILCKRCERIVHDEMLDDNIDFLLNIIQQLQKTEAPPQMRSIGFMKKNGWDKPKVFKNRYHRLKEGEK